ncbi:MAG TPA: hypothetical protein DCS93_12010 [Microscillaceae bacterium]|nr:hypothetical protein [Microscillaceae bacterium]
MQKLIFLTGVFLFTMGHYSQAQKKLYKTKNSKVTLFLNSTLQPIKATNNAVTSTFNPQTKIVSFLIPMKQFQFNNPILQQPFNETYLEASKYPLSKFEGMVKEPIDFNKTTPQKVTVVGYLNMHGVRKKRVIPAIIVVKDNEVITCKSGFDINTDDHKIKIPPALFKDGQKVVKINLLANYN